jgi:uncharacterized damage-inducible protein DinB
MESQSIGLLRELIRHMEWADAEVWRAVLGNESAVNDARLNNLLTHVHVVQRLFLILWTKQRLDPASAQPSFATLGDLRAWALTYYPESNRFLGALDESTLKDVVEMPLARSLEARIGRTISMPTVGETIQQVASHSTYHRGQINARLREVGGEPPLVDYIAWIWFGRPAPNWSLAPAAA